MTEIQTLQAALAAEHAVVYGYGVAGAHLAGSDRDLARAALLAHQVRRDRLIALVTAVGQSPVTAQPAYQIPSPVTDAASARRLAGRLEQSAAGAAWDLAAAATAASPARSLAVAWLTDAAVRATHWGDLRALPGEPT